MTDVRQQRRVRMLWSTAAVIALFWPAHTAGPLDGIPFDTRAEAILLGLVLPAVWWFDRSVFDRVAARIVVVAMLVLKIGSTALLTQSGLCTEFRAERPIAGDIEAIQFDSPATELPSWDVRAPARCSAITARSYRSRIEFPTWFVNVLDSANPRQSRVMMRTTGVMSTTGPGTLALQTTPDMEAALTVDGHAVGATAGSTPSVALGGGVHEIAVTALLNSSDGKFEPTWDGADLWRAARTTIALPSTLDRFVGPLVAPAILICALALMALWIVDAVANAQLSPIEASWVAAASAALMIAGRMGLDRPAVPLLFAVLLLPTASRRANVRGGFLLVGIPWLALFAASSLDRIGTFSTYTRGNDWLTYQISAYRIYRFGAWLEAGEKTFFYQPLYRWICGALHLVFGDSSVGELYWDAACLLAAALLALHIAKRAGRTSAVVAAVSTLSIAAIGPIWHLIGRGLAEISAMGFATLAMFWMLRARRSAAAAAVAGVFAVLAYYTRLNHMLFAAGLIVLTIPLRVRSYALQHALGLLGRTDVRVVATYAAVLALGLLGLAARTAHYTGHFSIFQGTSLTLNYLGFDVPKIAHSVLATAIANESFDMRGLPILTGVVAALLAVVQVPGFSALPLAPSLLCLVGMVSAFIAHAHGYPGRFSVHLLPITTALTVIAVANGVALRGRRLHHVGADNTARPEIA